MSTSAAAVHCRGLSNDCIVMLPLKRVVLISPPHFFCNNRSWCSSSWCSWMSSRNNEPRSCLRGEVLLSENLNSRAVTTIMKNCMLDCERNYRWNRNLYKQDKGSAAALSNGVLFIMCFILWARQDLVTFTGSLLGQHKQCHEIYQDIHMMWQQGAQKTLTMTAYEVGRSYTSESLLNDYYCRPFISSNDKRHT